MGNQIARTAQRTVIDSTVDPSKRNDRWLTPPTVVEALGTFDLDPCGAPEHSLARITYLQENGADGLVDPWFGRVWPNPPYGREMRKWVERLVEHGTGTALIPVAAGTKLWQEVVFPEASAIVAFGDSDADALIRSDLPGVALDLRTPA